MVFWCGSVYGDLRLLDANDLRVSIIENVDAFGMRHELGLNIETCGIGASIGAGFSAIGSGNFFALGWVGKALILLCAVFGA